MGRVAGFEPELLSFASGTATFPMSYARPLIFNNLSLFLSFTQVCSELLHLEMFHFWATLGLFYTVKLFGI
jgi:hypothetical protein